MRNSQVRLRLTALVGRSAKVTDAFERRRVDIVALQKVRYRNEGVKPFRGDFEYNSIGKVKIQEIEALDWVKRELVKSVMDV